MPTTVTTDATTGQQLVVSLLAVSRRLKARLPQSNLDPAMMFVLHQVQANGSLRVSELAGCMGLDASTASRRWPGRPPPPGPAWPGPGRPAPWA